MSIVRFSVLGDVPCAPDRTGNIDLRRYSRRRQRGMMAPLREPAVPGANSDLHHYLARSIERAAAELPAAAPVVIMVHGFLFDPKQVIGAEPKDTDNPHGRLYHFTDGDESEEQRHHTASWPLGLGFAAEDASGRGGLAIAFGWQSQPGLASSLIQHFQNFYARAYDKGGLAAWILANLIRGVTALLPGHPIDLVCHSLGAHVVVRAIALAADRGLDGVVERLGRVILLGGAEYVVEAQLMQRRLARLGLAGGPVFYNIVSRENDVLDILGENFGPRTFGNSQVIGHNGLDIEQPAANWMDLQIDSARLQGWMAAKGFTISGDRPDNVWDHWYYYTFRGNMAVYREILRNREAWRLTALRNAQIPEGVSRRWWDFGD